MQRHLQRDLQRDIKHIVTMQSLLQEYDRENKYLNKQVLDLINENTKLRMDKLKANIIHDVLNTQKKSLKTPTKNNIITQFARNSQKIEPTKGQTNQQKATLEEDNKELLRSSSKKIVEKFKIDSDKKPLSPSIAKKDEGVQTPPIEKATAQTQQDEMQHSQLPKSKQEIAFSFRHPPGKLQFQSPSASSKKFISQCQIKFGESSNELSKNLITNFNNDSSALAISREKSQGSIQRDPSRTIINENQETIKRESSVNQLHFRRSHAIRPSPQIDTSLSKHKRQFLTPSSSQKRLGNRAESQVKLRPFESVQKKRKFLQIVSASLTPSKMGRGDKDDCC